MLDVAIIGAGITGAMIAHELSAYELSVAVFEKELDAANGVTLANSAIIHSGYDPEPGSMKGRVNAAGNARYTELCKLLDVAFKRIGSLTVAVNEAEIAMLKMLEKKAAQNGVQVELIGKDRLREMEPNISDQALAALYAPSAGIIDPWEITYALLEHAAENGVAWVPGTEIKDMKVNPGFYTLVTPNATYDARMVINAAGLYSDKIHNMVSTPAFEIKPRRGEYFILDKSEGSHVNHVIFPCPSNQGKGILVSPTIHGNLIVGPTSESVEGRDDAATTLAGMAKIHEQADRIVKQIDYRKTIRNFAGLRPSTDHYDFIVGYASGQEGFIDVAGIDSPGLASAPAIAQEVVKLLGERLALAKKSDIKPPKPRIKHFAAASQEEKQLLIEDNPQYGNIICRCETVTEAEIVACIHQKIGARTVKGIKKRTRPGSGRCQGAFCGPKIVEILARELNMPQTQVLYDLPGSEILVAER